MISNLTTSIAARHVQSHVKIHTKITETTLPLTYIIQCSQFTFELLFRVLPIEY